MTKQPKYKIGDVVWVVLEFRGGDEIRIIKGYIERGNTNKSSDWIIDISTVDKAWYIRTDNLYPSKKEALEACM